MYFELRMPWIPESCSEFVLVTVMSICSYLNVPVMILYGKDKAIPVTGCGGS
jgi:hypothetical protein